MFPERACLHIFCWQMLPTHLFALSQYSSTVSHTSVIEDRSLLTLAYASQPKQGQQQHNGASSILSLQVLNISDEESCFH